jgi:hypothetical protein
MTMINLREAFEDRGFRGVFIICAAAIAVRGVVFALAAASSSPNRQVSDEVPYHTMLLRALPRTGTNKINPPEEPLNVVSQIVGTLKLRDRTQRLQSSSSGVSIQPERMFGGGLLDFLVSPGNSGLEVRAAEIRSLPASDIRLPSVSLTVEPAK